MSPMRLVGQWRQAIGTTNAMAENVERVIDQTTAQEAMAYRVMVNRAFVQGGPPGFKWKPLSPVTIKLRAKKGMKGTKPLIATGSLRGSVNLRKAGHAKYFVGVSRGTQRKDGGKNVDIAMVHEIGAVVPSKSGARYFLIPQRSFLDSTFRRFIIGANIRAMARFRKNLLKASGAR